MTDSLLACQALFCERDDRVLFSDLSFSLSAGEIVQVQGRNGAGKSTLLRILAGLYTNFEGDLFYNDAPMKELAAEYFSDLCFLGHRLPVKSQLTALENLRYYTSISGAWSEAAAMNALAAVGLRGYEDSYCSDMSAGQQRRVGLARLWLTSARVWILDEPFTALDIDAVAMLENFLREAASESRLVIFTSHHVPKIDSLRSIVLGRDGGVYRE